MQQILSIHIGQCGLQIGSALWELLTFEHRISQEGFSYDKESGVEWSNAVLFNVCCNGKHVPRAIFVDLEPSVIDEMKNGSYRKIFHPDQLISGPEDAANNFARGFYTVGRIIKATLEHQIRKEIERCNYLQAFHLYRGLGGGTGSGMTAILLEILSEYSKTTKLEIPIHPSPHLSNAVVEPYNCILSEHFSMEDIDISFIMDNEAIYDIITEEITLLKPTFNNLNRVIAQVCSSLTSSTRFPSDLYNDFSIMTNLVPYPRIHFPLVSYAPLGNYKNLERNKGSVFEITKAVFWAGNQMVKCDPCIGKFMSCSMLYRGSISPTEVYDALASIKSGGKVRFVDWCPTGFKIGIVNRPPEVLPESHFGTFDKNVIMLTNNSSVSSVWHRLSQKFHRLYSKRSFIHWFVAEGLEENEFCESLYNIATLAKDYEEVSLDTASDKGNLEVIQNISSTNPPLSEKDVKMTSIKKSFNRESKGHVNSKVENSIEQKVDQSDNQVSDIKDEKEEKKEEEEEEEEDEEGSSEKNDNHEENISNDIGGDEDFKRFYHKSINSQEEEIEDNNSDEKDENQEMQDEKDDGKNKTDNKNIDQENVSNKLNYNSVLGKQNFRNLLRSLRPSCENIKLDTQSRNQNNVSIINLKYNLLSNNKNNQSEKAVEIKSCDLPLKTVFNSSLYKKNFIKKCAQKRQSLTSLLHLEFQKSPNKEF